MSENGSLSSLLKYRFNRRPTEKLNHSSSASASSGGVRSQPETENGDSNGPASHGHDVDSNKCLSAGDTLIQGSSSSTSKSRPVINGGQVSDSHQDGKMEAHPKAAVWQEELRSMFPSSTPQALGAALQAATTAGTLEAGIDYMVKGRTTGKRSHHQTDPDPEGEGSTSLKRARTIPADSQDSQATLPLSQPGSQSLNDSQCTEGYSLTDSQRTDSYSLSQSEETSIEFLRGAFPSLPQERLRKALEDCHGNTDQAVTMLSEAVKEAETTNQPQSSHGTRSSKNVKHEELSLSDEEDDYDEEGEDSDDSADEDGNSSKREIILSFLEEATLAELLVLPGCSRKKAEALLELRPFGSWEKLVETLQTSKQLSYSLVQGCQEIIQLRNVVLRLMKQCEHISGQMEQVVSRLSGRLQGPREQEDYISSQPALLNSDFELKPYQLIGLNWLRIMHSQELNGILADEMGLGKTVQAISFLAHLLEEGEQGPHVIIVPSSTIENWLRELSAWCPALGVIVYYGSQEERRATRHSIMYEGRDDFHVLLTTYNMATGGVEDRSLFKKFQFHYAVFDEGHMLKNMSSLRFQNLMKISAERRLLLTGTPLQNNLLELMSLLCFVMPDIFQGKTEPLKKLFSMISKGDSEQGKYEKERIAQAQRIMRPFVLRRLKKDVLTQLPKKEESIQHCTMVPHQQDVYNSLVQKFSVDVERNGTESGGGVAMFMQLRKAANHPLLLRYHYDDRRLLQMANALAKEPSHKERGALPKLIKEDMEQMNDFDLILLCQQYKKHIGKYELDSSWIRKSGKFQQLDNLLDTMKQQGDRVLLFSQFTMMLDIVEVFLRQKKMRYLRLDGSTPVTDRQRLIDEFNEDPDIFIFLLSTRAGGLGINLTAANTIILHDIDFNPYNDKQAEDRCHRLGQKRTVKIIRLITENSVEEGMLRVAQGKLRLEQDVTTANDESTETQADVAMLLREAIGQVKGNNPSNSATSSTMSSSSGCSSSSS